MNVGMRHPSVLRRGLSAFASMSVIALLALACLPSLTRADSSGVQYSDDLPGLPAEKGRDTGKKQPPAKSSKTQDAPAAKDGGTGQKDGAAEDSSEGDSSKAEGAAVGGNDRGNGQGNPGGSATPAGKAQVQPNGQAPSGSRASEPDDEGGSSPLVPILIAILVLAAISVAVVMVKQRRQRGGAAGTSPSPKAS